MTLLIYCRCSDGFVIVSDRKEKYGIIGQNEVTKFFLSDDNSFYVSLSADGTLPKGIITMLCSSDISKEDVRSKIENYVKNENRVANGFVQSTHAGGFLVIKNDSEFKIEIIEIHGQMIYFADNSALFFSIGSEEGKLFTTHFLQNISISEMSCNEATKYVLATMNEISKTIETIGSFKQGYDIVKFLDSGEVIPSVRFSDSDIAKIKIEFEIKDSEEVFPNSNNGDKKNG